MWTSRGTIQVEKNAGNGILVDGNSVFAAAPTALYLVKQNKRAGLRVFNGASVILNKSIFADNGTDVALSFGARAILKGSTVGTITCDKSSMIRGDVACPE